MFLLILDFLELSAFFRIDIHRFCYHNAERHASEAAGVWIGSRLTANNRSTVVSQLSLPNCHLNDGREHWRNPLWSIPLIHETMIPAPHPTLAFRTRLANLECRHLHQHAAGAAICSARCFWQRSLSLVTSSIGTIVEPIPPLHLRRHQRHKASLQHRLQLHRHKIRA